MLSSKLENIKTTIERTKQKEINDIYGISQASVAETKTKDDTQLSTSTSTSSENNANETKSEKPSNSNTEKNKENSVIDKRKGRLGPKTVLFPKKGIVGSVILGENELEVFVGKWLVFMYRLKATVILVVRVQMCAFMLEIGCMKQL